MTMKKVGLLLTFCSFSLFFTVMTLNLQARSSSILWQNISERTIPQAGERWIVPQEFQTLHLQIDRMTNLLAECPAEFYGEIGVIVPIPMPDGTIQHFEVWDSPVMHPDLAKQYPEIQAYTGQGLTDKTAILKMDVTPQGFHAMILRAGQTVYIDPYQTEDREHYISYYTNEYETEEQFICQKHQHLEQAENLPTMPHKKQLSENGGGIDNQQSAVVLRTYQIAIAATGEYTQFHGGTVAGAMAAINTTMVRNNGVYERDIAVRFILIANNNQIVFTDPVTDPYFNDSDSLYANNQFIIDSVLGSSTTYDIGHVFSVGSGGVAAPGPCDYGGQAYGVTALDTPVGDSFDIGYVAHEIGHQLFADHTFNGTQGACDANSLSPNTAYEPGAGSTIMSYSDICGNDETLQSNSDDYFHVKSLEQMIFYTRDSLGNTCPGLVPTGNNDPTAEAGASYTIPINTPFLLTSPNSSDPDGDAITYCWEQYDLGPTGDLTMPVGNAPIFRSYQPTTSPSRYFPKLSGLASGNFPIGELLPSYARTLNFRLTVRDNKASGGGIDIDGMQVDAVDMGGVFAVTTPNANNISWPAGSTQTITWSVGNTTNAPVSCANVDILISTNGGNSFATTLATNVPNSGSHSLTFPSDVASAAARIMIKCSDNVFFDISDQNFALAPDPANIVCTTYTSTNIPVTIPSTGTSSQISVPSTLNVPDDVAIYDINVLNLTGTHSYVADLFVELTSPMNTSISLMDAPCDDEDDFNLNFDDAASSATLPCPPTDGDTYQPQEGLSSFNGQNAIGTWTLTVTDTAPANDGGSLDSWSIEICSFNTTPPAATVLQVKTFLQGAYSSGSMSTNLQTNGLLATTQPFSGTPWNYLGTESIANATGLPTNMVDWVLVEARDANDNEVILEQKAGLLLSDGSVISTDGSVGIVFTTLTANQNYYVSVKHRNHIGLLSASTVAIPNATPFDFTMTANVLDGVNQLRDLGDGNMGMATGDYDGNGTIIVADFNAFLSQSSTINTYVNEDGNLDGNVTVFDYNLYLTNASLIGVAQIRY